MGVSQVELGRLRVRLAETYPSLFSLLGSLDVGVVFHSDGLIVAANSVANRLAGRSLEGSSVTSIVATEEHDVVHERLAALAQVGGALSRRRYRSSGAAAEARQVEIETALLPAGVDGHRVMMSLVSDVSSDAPRNENELRALLAMSVDAVLIVDEHGRVQRANTTASALLGYTAAEFVGLQVEQLIPPEQRAAHVEHRAGFAQNPTARPMRTGATMFALTKSGLTMPIEVALAPLVLEGARVTVVTMRDLASRLEAARAVRESEARHRRIFEAASDGILIADAGGRYVDVNPAGCAMLRCARSDIIGKSMEDFVMPEDLAAHPLRTGDVVGGARFTVERVMRRFDGTPMVAEISTAVLPGGLVQGIVRDLSERRRVENTLRDVAKLEAVGRLAGGVAHDFNNILTVVLSLTDELKDRLAQDVGSLELVEEIENAGRRAAELTKQLLAFARRQPNNPRVIDVNDELRRLSRFLQRALGEDIELVFDLANDLPGSSIDPVQFEQCIVNLSVNARDAMPGGGHLRLRTKLLDGGLGIDVEDEGQGMDDETLRHVFEPFFTTKPVGHGTGLGLATVYGIVSQAGGRLSVDSAVGKGSTFHVWLPLAGAPVEPRVAPLVSRAAGSEHILVVEDDAGVRTSVERTLRGAGYTVHATDGIDSALEVARGVARLDLLLSDIVMPRADGLKVAEAVRGLRPGLPVLFMSGYASDTHRLAALGGVITKPFLADALFSAVRAALVRPA